MFENYLLRVEWTSKWYLAVPEIWILEKSLRSEWQEEMIYINKIILVRAAESGTTENILKALQKLCLADETGLK